MDTETVLERIQAALEKAGFRDVDIVDGAVLFNDDDGNAWALTPEQF